jgi:glycogen operon protein
MTDEDWRDGQRRTLGMQLGNDAADGHRFLVLFSSAADPVEFRLPDDFPDGNWIQVFDTRLARGSVRKRPIILRPGTPVSIEPLSLMLFQHGHLTETH